MRSAHFIAVVLSIATLLISACSESSPELIKIEDAWIREAPPGANAMAGYMQIKNLTGNHIILHSANSNSFNSIEFHRSVEKEGVYKMIPQYHLHIAADSTFELKPGDYHLMLFKPTRALKHGDHVDISLVFSNNIVVDITTPVKKAEY